MCWFRCSGACSGVVPALTGCKCSKDLTSYALTCRWCPSGVFFDARLGKVYHYQVLRKISYEPGFGTRQRYVRRRVYHSTEKLG